MSVERQRAIQTLGNFRSFFGGLHFISKDCRDTCNNWVTMLCTLFIHLILGEKIHTEEPAFRDFFFFRNLFEALLHHKLSSYVLDWNHFVSS